MTAARRSALVAVTLAATALLAPAGPGHAAVPDCSVSTPFAANDFNGDGFADLAIGDPGALVGTSAGAGAVEVHYGNRAGGQGDGATQRIAQGAGAAGAGDVSEPGDAFGTSLDWGLVDGDFCADLIVGVPGEDVGTASDGGLVEVVWGSESGLGLGPRPALRLRPASGFPGTPQTGARLGTSVDFPDASLLAGKPAGQARPVAMGAPFQDVGSAADAGEVDVVLITPAGTLTQPRRLTQATTGLAGNPEAGARFGSAVEFSLLSSVEAPNWHVDLLAGAPGSHGGAGAVIHLLERAPASFQSREWTQDTTGMGDTSEAGDQFGYSLDSFVDPFSAVETVAVGTPSEDLGAIRDAGTVHLVTFQGNGPFGTVFTDTVVSQDSTDVADAAESGDHFGLTVEQEMMRSTASSKILLVGVPDEDVGTLVNAGAVAGFNEYETVLGRTDVFVTASSTGVPGNPSTGARLGAAVMPAGSGAGELLIGVPDGTVWPTGAVMRLPISTYFGLSSTAGTVWTPRVSGGARYGAAFH